MHLVFTRSEIKRATCSQELTIALEAATDPCCVREVQIVVPSSPTVFAVIDPSTEDLGENKTFNFPLVHPGQLVQFKLGPKQRLALASKEGIAQVSLVVEHYHDATLAGGVK